MSSWPNSTAADNGRRPLGRVSLIREGLSSSICRTPAMIAERGRDGEVVRRSARDEQPRDVVVDRSSPLAPDREVDRLQIARIAGVDVRATIEQEVHGLTTAAEHGTVERRDAAAASDDSPAWRRRRAARGWRRLLRAPRPR